MYITRGSKGMDFVYFGLSLPAKIIKKPPMEG